MTIENVRLNEWELLYNMAKESEVLDVHTPHTYYLMCMMFKDQIFTLKNDDEAIGYIMSIKNDHYVFIWQIAIKPEYRQKGLSKYLYEAVEEFCNKHKIEVILLSIDPNNVASKNALYSYCLANNHNIIKYDGIDLHIDNINKYEDIYMISL